MKKPSVQQLLVEVLAEEPDFRFFESRTALHDIIEAKTHLCDFYPKFHCELWAQSRWAMLGCLQENAQEADNRWREWSARCGVPVYAFDLRGISASILQLLLTQWDSVQEVACSKRDVWGHWDGPKHYHESCKSSHPSISSCWIAAFTLQVRHYFWRAKMWMI